MTGPNAFITGGLKGDGELRTIAVKISKETPCGPPASKGEN